MILLGWPINKGAFQLKLLCACVADYVDMSKLVSDTSDRGLGAVLSQLQVTGCTPSGG